MAPRPTGGAALPQIVPIADPCDPRIEAYRDVRERDLVGRQGLFIAEGEVVVRRLIGSARHETLSLLVAEKRVEGLADALAALPEGVPVFAASQEAMDGVVGFHIHRGILALGRPREAPSAEALLGKAGERALVVVLVGLANHDNVGGVFRNAAAFGADAVILDAECCDPLYRKATRVSVGATLLVPFARLARGADPVAPLLAAGLEPIALTPDGATPLAEATRPARVALILGPEGPGPRPCDHRSLPAGSDRDGGRPRLPQRGDSKRHRAAPFRLRGGAVPPLDLWRARNFLARHKVGTRLRRGKPAPAPILRQNSGASGANTWTGRPTRNPSSAAP